MNHKHSLFGKCKSVLLTVALASAFTAVGQVDADEVKNPSQVANDLAQVGSNELSTKTTQTNQQISKQLRRFKIKLMSL